MLRIQRNNLDNPGEFKPRESSEGQGINSLQSEGRNLSLNYLSKESKLLRQIKTEIFRLKTSGANVSRAEVFLESARKALENGNRAIAENHVARAGIEARRLSSPQETRTGKTNFADNSKKGTAPIDTKTPGAKNISNRDAIPSGGLDSLRKSIEANADDNRNNLKTARENNSRTRGDNAVTSSLDFRGQASLASLDLSEAQIGTGETTRIQPLTKVGVTSSPAESFSETSRLAATEAAGETATIPTPAGSMAMISKAPTMADLSEILDSETQAAAGNPTPAIGYTMTGFNQAREDTSLDQKDKSLGNFRLRGLFRRAFRAYFGTFNSSSVIINFNA